MVDRTLYEEYCNVYNSKADTEHTTLIFFIN